MEDIILKNLLKSILIGEKIIKIEDQIFPIKRMIGQGHHKQVFEIDDEENNKVIKIVRKDAKDITSAFLSFEQAIDNQKVLKSLGLNYAKIIDFDKKLPYRYLVQEKIPEQGVYVASLIRNNELDETDICQISKIINYLEREKKWQLDTSPFNWFKVDHQLVYTGGTVYKYDENWSFNRVGLWQWVDPAFTSETADQSTKIPTKKDEERLVSFWQNSTDQKIRWWKRYLNSNVQPKVAA